MVRTAIDFMAELSLCYQTGTLGLLLGNIVVDLFLSATVGYM